MTTPTRPSFYCCDYSQQAGEQLFATATQVSVWLLLEHTGAWGEKAFEESDLPGHVKDRLNAYLDAIPGSRMQLIRQDRGRSTAAFFVAVSDEMRPALYRFDLSSYDDLLALDVTAVVSGAYPQYAAGEPLFAVCVNGKRDISCARYGTAAYRAMAQHGGASVWQTTHIGGHRFAATCACLPHGVLYGRIAPERAAQVIDETRRGCVVLDLYRGRSCYTAEAQAAEYYLRAQTGVLDLPGFRLVEVETTADNTFAVCFESLADGIVYRVEVFKETPGVPTYQNSTDTEPALMPQFRLMDYRAVEMWGS